MPAADVVVAVQTGRRGGLRVEAVAAALAELDAATAVQRGAAWLDQQLPDWPDLIDLDRLDMAHGARCILGQVFGDYYSVRIELDAAVRMGFDADRSGLRMGRPGDWDGLTARYAALAAAWCRLIRARRGEVDGDD